MRLTQIKLAGFKSFVDPTSFAVPSKLVGVVGPNGCGKSNIIDAVRWVLGESKASELRGESMQDVIFNGSSTRKPASRASVELVFDNAEARAGGQWNQFSEISVKRVLTRDGTSTYYINQQPVRRRDVQDIFLGTGLGPRAYAIIGQGMIARIIEARPEELRVFLEEAAGVSKYKERRRETENRLQDTRDNLTRVEDILRELNANIEKLQAQAKVAQQYRDFEAERNDKQRLLWFIRWSEALQEQGKYSAAIEQARAELEGLNAASISAQTELISLRQHQVDAQQGVDAQQQAWVEVNRTVSRLEADLRVMAEAKQRLAQKIAESLAQQEQWKVRLEEISTELQAAEEDSGFAQEDLAQSEVMLEDAKAATEPAQERLDTARRAQAAKREEKTRIEQQQQLLAQKRESAARTLSQLEIRRERLAADKRATSSPDPQALGLAQGEQERAQQALQEAHAQKQALVDRVETTHAAFEQAQTLASAEKDKLTAVSARLDALGQLHERLTSKSELAPWLRDMGLADQPKVLQKVRVENGWEKALEAVLKERLSALEVSQLERIAGFAGRLPKAALAFVAPGSHPLPAPAGTQYLYSRVQCADAALSKTMGGWLAGVRIAANLNDAISGRGSLAAGECFVTPEGHCVSSDTVVFYVEKDESAGALARLQEMENLERELRALKLVADTSESQRVSALSAWRNAQAVLQECEQSIARLTRLAHDAQIHLLKLTEANERARQKVDQIDMELSLLADEHSEQEAIALEAEDAFAALDEQLMDASEAFERTNESVFQAEQSLRDLEMDVRDKERALQEAGFKIRALQARQVQLNRDRQLAAEQAVQAQRSLQYAQEELSGLDDEAARMDLQDALEARVVAEMEVSKAREVLDTLMGQVRAAEEAERAVERQAQPLRDRINDLTLKEQAARLTIEQYDQQLNEVSADRESLAHALADLVPAPKPSVLQAEVTRLTNAITALGPVNLAALDELTAASERKLFLDQQSADLVEAMTTLEDAIHKIDKETRALLQDTFNTVNGHFSSLFPQLFGGGEARLVMSGEEILDAGVQVFAQPPGKKNGTIHLLSGGEKALTATALVFAIFELNPAPFCLLDEVDAPLDDANTERFSRLVKKMSAQTQFLFISHNKIAMEMAEQLIGVTMQEKGVSRIVAVDLASAEQLATENL